MTTTSASRGASANSRSSGFGADGDDVLRNVLRKLIRPAVDPAHGERQRRQSQHHGAADMAGAEQQHRGRHLAEMFTERCLCRTPHRRFHRHAGRSLAAPAYADNSCRRRRRGLRSRRSPAFSACLQTPHRREIIGVERFGERLHHAAAALAEIGPERPIAELRLATSAPPTPHAPRQSPRIPAGRRRCCRKSRHPAAGRCGHRSRAEPTRRRQPR